MNSFNVPVVIILVFLRFSDSLAHYFVINHSQSHSTKCHETQCKVSNSDTSTNKMQQFQCSADDAQTCECQK